MKKTLTLLVLLLITTIGFAQSFVMITTDNQQETENLFNNKNLKIHYYNDNFVLATAKTVLLTLLVLSMILEKGSPAAKSVSGNITKAAQTKTARTEKTKAFLFIVKPPNLSS